MPPRRTAHELCLIYRLHPEFRDLYVEGRDDARFWRWLTKTQHLTHVQIYSGDTIEPLSPAETSNNKARVIALARVVAEVFGEHQTQVTCVVDLDFDHIELTKMDCACLFYTEATSLETEFYKPQYMEKFLGLACKLDIELEQFQRGTDAVLRQLSSFRLANARLKWGLRHLSFERDLDLLRDFSIEFDRDSFIRRYLQQDGKLRERDAFEKAASDAAAQLPVECYKAAHGHDFVALLGWFELKAVREVRQDDEVARWLYAIADLSIADEAPFCHILRRLGRALTL